MSKPSTVSFRCRVCDAAQECNIIFAREMMYGTGEPFEYVACAACDCVQILAIPSDLSRFYPLDYYSMDAPHERWWWAQLKLRRAVFVRTRRSLIGRMVARLRPPPPAPSWLSGARLSFDESILDIGCGAGQLLLQLRDLGFKRLSGVDPFVNRDINYAGGVRILKAQLSDIQDHYRFVMLHHSLEHMPDQLGTLRAVRRLIADGGRALVRIPLLGFAWRTYGTDWLGLDPPRHLYAHTVKSFSTVAQKAGLAVRRIEYDSSGLQFWASEQFRRGIALFAPESVARGARHNFSESQLAQWDRQSTDLNAAQDGDQAAFFLEPV